MAIYSLQMIAQASRLFGMSFDQEIIVISSVLLKYIFYRKHKEIYIKIYRVSKIPVFDKWRMLVAVPIKLFEL